MTIQVSHILLRSDNTALHVYSDNSTVEYKQDGNDWIAPFSRTTEDQYKATQRYKPEETFLLQLFT